MVRYLRRLSGCLVRYITNAKSQIAADTRATSGPIVADKVFDSVLSHPSEYYLTPVNM